MDAGPRPRPLRRRARSGESTAAGQRCTGGGQLRHRPGLRGRGAGVRRRGRELDRRRFEPGLRARLLGRRGHLRYPPLKARRRDRAVVKPGVWLPGGLGRLGVGVVADATEEEPRRGGAPAGQGAKDRRPPGRASRRHAWPPADLQQGHAGGQGASVRCSRHPRAVPRSGGRDAGLGHIQPRAAGVWGVR